MAKGHEFWIDTRAYQVAPGESVLADLMVGTEFEGSRHSYIPRNFKRFEIWQDGRVTDMPGVVGDRPAANFVADDEGLIVLVHETTNLSLTWDTWEKFEAFVRHKDAEWVLEAHLEAELSQENVREVYSRHAKSLIAVGAGAGEDVVAGLPTEIVALENPYTDDMSDGIEVKVLYEGKPRVDVQVEVFEKSNSGDVRIFMVRTDDQGVATVPVEPGREYMLDAVVLRRPLEQPVDKKPYLWESLWANLTFAVPG